MEPVKRVVLVCALLSLALPVGARELPSYFQGARPLGMGGAFTAVADDENALFYNPAGLDRVEHWGMGVVNPLVEVGENGYQFYRDVEDTDLDDTQEVVDLLRDYLGEYIHYRAALFPHFVLQHVAFGILGQANVNVEPHNQAFPEAEVNAFGSIGAHLGVGFGFFDHRLRVGGGVKYVRAYRLTQIYTAADVAADDFEDRVDDDLDTGAGIGFDVGAMYTFPVVLRPTVAAVIQNIADTDLGPAGELPQQINLGLSLGHEFSWLSLTGALDWVDVTTQLGQDDDPFKRIHLGLEARLPKVLSVRAGLHQGYTTFGATLDLWVLKLDYANYAEEIGSGAGVRADRRHVVQATLGW